MPRELLRVLRNLSREPGFSGVSIAILAVGIGANAFTASLASVALINPLGLVDPERTVRLAETYAGTGTIARVSAPNFLDWRRQQNAFDGVAALLRGRNVNWGAGTSLERLGTARISADLFPVLERQPILGRPFLADDELPESPRVVILSHRRWQLTFGARETLVGESILFDGVPYEVVGVMPPEAKELGVFDVFMPLKIGDEELLPAARSQRSLELWARLRPEVSIDEAQANLDVIVRRLEQEYPQSNENWRAIVFWPNTQIQVESAPAVILVWVASAALLVLACANLAHLMLARTVARRQDLAVRTALGASRMDLIRTPVMEAFALSVGAGFLSLAGLAWLTGAIRVLPTLDQLGFDQLSVDWTTVAFAALLACGTTVAIGVAPVVEIRRSNLRATLSARERSVSLSAARKRFRNALLASECAFSVFVLVLAGVAVGGYIELQRTDLGFRVENLLKMRIEPPEALSSSGLRLAQLYEGVLGTVRSIPGVSTTAIGSASPIRGAGGTQYLDVDGADLADASNRPWTEFFAISPGYFRTLEMSVVRGRPFEAGDTLGSAPVAIVNESLGRTLFGDENALGRVVTLVPSQGGQAVELLGARQIIGVVADVKYHPPSTVAPPAFYVPYAQSLVRRVDLIVRTESSPLSFLEPVRAAISRVEPSAAVYNIGSMAGDFRIRIQARQTVAGFLAVLSGLGLTLLCVGAYGVTAYSAAQESREIGVRMALGAAASRVVWDSLARSLKPCIVALPAGVAMAAAGLVGIRTVFPESASGQYIGTDSADVLLIAALLAFYVLVVATACFLPARRAALADPVACLRG